MTNQIEGQMSMFDQDTWYGRMFREHSAAIKEMTSDVSLKKPQKYQKKMPQFLDLRGANGTRQDASWEMDGASLGAYMMHNFGEFHKEENEYVFLLTSTETPHQEFYLNCSEKPMKEMKTKLSWVLEKNPNPKYNLSARACQGILNRANKRGKSLPEMLENALIRQVSLSKLGGGTEFDSSGKRAGKGALVQTELSGTIGVSQDQSLICIEGNGSRDSHKGDGYKETDVMYSLNTVEQHAVAYRKQGHPQNSEQGQGWEETSVNDTLNAFDSGEARTPTVVLENHPADSRVKICEDDIFQTLSSRMGTGGGNVPMVMESVAIEEESKEMVYGISPYHSNAMKSSNPKSGIYEADTSRTLDLNGGNPACNQGGMMIVQNSESMTLFEAYQHHGYREGDNCNPLTAQQNSSIRGDTPLVCEMTTSDGDNVAGTLDSSYYKGVGLRQGRERTIVAESLNSTVRRLTPLECERLQGFPDNWTDIGEWIDTKGKKRKDSDSPRYKALGNSIALPFWRWLAERITANYDRRTTMASLFDGIGGFPLVFSQFGSKPLWASEIEDFPIAVTKIRFGEDET